MSQAWNQWGAFPWGGNPLFLLIRTYEENKDYGSTLLFSQEYAGALSTPFLLTAFTNCNHYWWSMLLPEQSQILRTQGQHASVRSIVQMHRIEDMFGSIEIGSKSWIWPKTQGSKSIQVIVPCCWCAFDLNGWDERRKIFFFVECSAKQLNKARR